MIYIIGTFGFFSGFILGQMILLVLLRGRTREELLTDRGLRWKFGALNWLVALATAASAVWIYDAYFM